MPDGMVPGGGSGSGGSGSSTQGTIAGNLGATATVNFAGTKQQIDLAGTLNAANCVVTYSNRVAGCVSVIMVLQDGTGGRTLQVSDGLTPQSVYVNPTPGSLSMVQVKCPDSTNIEVASIGGSGISRTAIAVPYAAAITPALPTGDAIFEVGALTGAITVNNPSGTPWDGQMIQFTFAQDGTGGRVITWGAAFAFGTDVTAAMIPTTLSAQWRMLFVWNAAASAWRALAIVRGF